tara:strand:- start:7173 stop:7670 length:498 start_codon:yes stop_codon:yes gene_type:complete
MSVEEIELDVGGVKFKGVYIAILMSFATTIGGGIWAASEFVSRIDNLEASVAGLSSSIPDISPMQEQIIAIETKITDNDLGHLQGKLAELSTLLDGIKERQQEVLDNAAASNAKVNSMEKDWIEIRNEYKLMADAIKGFEDAVGKFKTEIDDLWKGLDAASSPLG